MPRLTPHRAAVQVQPMTMVKNSDCNVQEVGAQIQPSLLSADVIWGGLLNLSLSFLTCEMGFVTDSSCCGEK